MIITERQRHTVHNDLERAMGSDSANTLMQHLPPVGWADVATKRDLDHLGESLRHELAITRLELRSGMNVLRAELHRDMNSQTKTLFFSLAGLIVTLAALGFGALHVV